MRWQRRRFGRQFWLAVAVGAVALSVLGRVARRFHHLAAQSAEAYIVCDDFAQQIQVTIRSQPHVYVTVSIHMSIHTMYMCMDMRMDMSMCVDMCMGMSMHSSIHIMHMFIVLFLFKLF